MHALKDAVKKKDTDDKEKWKEIEKRMEKLEELVKNQGTKEANANAQSQILQLEEPNLRCANSMKDKSIQRSSWS